MTERLAAAFAKFDAYQLAKYDRDGPVKLRDVDEAQAAIVLAAKELAQTGELDIGGGKDDEMLY